MSTYLDLRPATPGSTPQTAPSWVESFDFLAAVKPTNEMTGEAIDDLSQSGGTGKETSVFRIRLRHPPKASDHLQMRVFFEDRATGPQTKVNVWNELGEKMMPTVKLGQRLDLPSSEALTVYMNGVNYIEIEAPGDGAQVRGVFLSWLETVPVLQSSDFPAVDAVRQPFDALPAKRTRHNDAYLFGAVTARLQGAKPVVLRPEAVTTSSYNFELEHVPLVALVSYEILGAAVDAPPILSVNGRSLGVSEFYLPDLADPSFQGEVREAGVQMNFRYTGWLRAQKLVPANLLSSGLNNLSVRLSNSADPVAIRSLSIQLKYDWEKLDSVAVPASSPYENH